MEAIIKCSTADQQNLQDCLNILSNIQQMVAENLISQQYKMTAACVASAAHLKLAKLAGELNENSINEHIRQALVFSQTALHIYEYFGFTQVVETTSEEILFRHSQALSANHHPQESAAYLARSYDELMRKYQLIPQGHHFRKTYLENIQIHREIQSAYSRMKNT